MFYCLLFLTINYDQLWIQSIILLQYRLKDEQKCFIIVIKSHQKLSYWDNKGGKKEWTNNTEWHTNTHSHTHTHPGHRCWNLHTHSHIRNNSYYQQSKPWSAGAEFPPGHVITIESDTCKDGNTKWKKERKKWQEGNGERGREHKDKERKRGLNETERKNSRKRKIKDKI